MTLTLQRPEPLAQRPEPLARSISRYAFVVPTTGLDMAEAAESAFARGDDDALRSAYDAHGSLIYSYCRRSVGDDRAKDITQEVFVSAWKARDRFDPSKGRLGAWLMGIAKNRLVDNVRSEKRHADRRANDDTVEIGVESDIDRVGDRMLVAEALKSLPDNYRTVIELAYIGDLTHTQIAEQTSLPLGTVKSDIRRGLAHIRKQLAVNP